MKALCSCIMLCCLLFPKTADARALHLAIVMPAETVDRFESDKEAYEGIRFPLFCGIASVYCDEGRFVFTKMTDLPIEWVTERLQPIEEKGYLYYYGHPPENIPVCDTDFFSAFMQWAGTRGFEAYHVSNGQEVPLKVVPRFKRTCPYDSKKSPPTECGYRSHNIWDLYIPFTEEEIKQIGEDHAR